MKTLKLVLGILITIGSSIYFMFSLSIYSVYKSFVSGLPLTFFIFFLLPIGLIILGIYLIVSASKEESEELKRYRAQEQREREALYPNRNYKAKNSSFYLMTPKEKLEYAYDRLPEKEQEKVQRYAETLLREIENQKYNQK